MHYAVLFPEAKILGIEMDHDNYEICQRNMQPFRSGCSVIQGAVWTSEGSVGYTGTMNSAFTVSESISPEKTSRAYSMMQLLDILDRPIIDFVKMDVEGAEANLLEQAEEWVGRVRCLKVEIHEPYTVEQCLAHLERQGLHCTRDARHWACVIAWNPLHIAGMSETRDETAHPRKSRKTFSR